jgi:hypothetical protein
MRQRPIAPFVKIPNNDPDWNYAGYDFSDFAQKAARVSSTLNADNPHLSAFRDRGGKLIIDNGRWMDPCLAYGTIMYFARVLGLDPTARKDVTPTAGRDAGQRPDCMAEQKGFETSVRVRSATPGIVGTKSGNNRPKMQLRYFTENSASNRTTSRTHWTVSLHAVKP